MEHGAGEQAGSAEQTGPGDAHDEWHPNTHRVQAAARDRGVRAEVRRFPEGTRTAEDAARAVDCDVAAICKSIVLSTDAGPVLVLTSGANRVDMAKVATLTDRGGVRRANADEARAATGQPIGGTAPFGHPAAMLVIVDEDLLVFDQVWAAGGTPDTVFPIPPRVLVDSTGAQVADVAQ